MSKGLCFVVKLPGIELTSFIQENKANSLGEIPSDAEENIKQR